MVLENPVLELGWSLKKIFKIQPEWSLKKSFKINIWRKIVPEIPGLELGWSMRKNVLKNPSLELL